MKTTICQSQSAAITRAFGTKLANALQTGGTILLHGELGSGKTTFVQGIGEALRVEHTITSPTFTLMSVYETPRHPVIHRLVHVDLYRVSYMDSVAQLDLPTYQHDPETLVIIEWPERNPMGWDNVLGEITFSADDIHHRTLHFEGKLTSLLD